MVNLVTSVNIALVHNVPKPGRVPHGASQVECRFGSCRSYRGITFAKEEAGTYFCHADNVFTRRMRGKFHCVGIRQGTIPLFLNQLISAILQGLRRM